MIVSKHPQRSTEWLNERLGKVGGTRAKGLFVPSDTLLVELIIEITGDELDFVYESDAMIRGTELEPIARQALSEFTGVDFKEIGFCTSKDYPLLGISSDGFTDCQTIGCEIKCPSAKKHIQTCLDDCIPPDNIHQCIHSFVVNPKLEKLYFLSYRPESIKPMFVTYITRQSIINLGTKARPKLMSVSDAVNIAQLEAVKLQEQIDEAIEKLKF